MRLWALYTLSREGSDRATLERAAKVLPEIEEDPFDRWAPVNAGLVRLGTGDAGGAAQLRSGLQRIYLPDDLRELIDDVVALRRVAGAELHSVLDECKDEIDARAAAARLPSPEEELDARDGEAGAELAAGLARVRLQHEASDWRGALAAAKAVDGHASTRRLLAVRVLTEATDAAYDSLLIGGADWPAEQLEAALEASEAASEPAAAARTEALLALARLRAGDTAGAREAAQRAVAAMAPYPGDPRAAFWRACGSAVLGADEPWALDDLLLPAPEITDDRAIGHTFPAARHLPSLQAWSADAEPVHDPRPVVRLGDALIPEDTGPSWHLFSTLMPAMRERVVEETGIAIPGTSYRDGPHLTPAEFEITIAGLAAERAPVPPDAADPIASVVERLEIALRRRLGQFVTLDDAMDLLAGAPEGERGPPAERAARLRVAAIMRALANDRVPLTRLDVIRRAAERSGTAMAAATAIRRELAAELPGSDAERLLELPEELAKRIHEVFDLDAGTLQAAASPPAVLELAQQLAAWHASASGPGSCAVVASREPERRIVQLLLRNRAIETPVLNREEVAATGRSATASERLHA